MKGSSWVATGLIEAGPRLSLHDLAANIRPPVKGFGINCSPLLRALSFEKLLKSEMRDRAADDDLPVVHIDLNPLAFVEPGSLRDN
jgi:hypothetical protein